MLRLALDTLIFVGARRLLRPRRQRPCSRCAAEKRDELAPPHAGPQGLEQGIVTVQASLLEGVRPAVQAASTDRPVFHRKQPDRCTAANWRIGPRPCDDIQQSPWGVRSWGPSWRDCDIQRCRSVTQTGPSWFCQRLFASRFSLVVATADMALPMREGSSCSGPQANHTNVSARAPTRAMAATARVSYAGTATSTLVHPSRGE
jgi:hypothetical protein